MALALILLAGVRACSRHPDRSLDNQPLVRDSAGVTIVENSRPSWGKGEEWKVGPPFTTIGALDGAPEEQLYIALSATRLSDGTVAVANGGTGEIRFFDRGGTFLRSVGREGEGPGEFRGGESPGLSFLTHAEGDTLLAWDLHGQTLSVFSAQGEFIRSIRLRGTDRVHFMKGVFRDRSMLLVVLDPVPSGPGWGGSRRRVERLVRFDAGGDSLCLIGDFPGTEFYVRAATGGFNMHLAPPWGRAM